MINDQLVTVVSARMADATHGVNAQLATVPRPGGQAAPPAVTVRDSYTHREVAEALLDDKLRDSGPHLWVMPPNELTFFGVRFTGAPDTQAVGLVYAAGRSESHIALRDAHRTLRAARRVLALWFNTLDNGGLQVGGCDVDPPTEFNLMTGSEDLAAAQVTAALFVSFPLVDRWALGAAVT